MIPTDHLHASLAASPLQGAVRLLAALGLTVGLVACQSEPDGSADRKRDAGAPPVVEITAAEYAFVAPDSVPAGWVTFRLNNEKAEEVHEMDLSRLPEGVSYSDFEETIPVWGSITERVQTGELGGRGRFTRRLSRNCPTGPRTQKRSPAAASSLPDGLRRRPCIWSPAPMPCTASSSPPMARLTSPRG